jgi:hypothetical protein
MKRTNYEPSHNLNFSSLRLLTYVPHKSLYCPQHPFLCTLFRLVMSHFHIVRSVIEWDACITPRINKGIQNFGRNSWRDESSCRTYVCWGKQSVRVGTGFVGPRIVNILVPWWSRFCDHLNDYQLLKKDRVSLKYRYWINVTSMRLRCI